ncbi:DUF6962 family protein [Rudanella lutea]|jgi:hypothetical protein|uniref:DUF6962 family protein n=1 Tax=Rudanella lutea TaxID=451374 RepID=UPI000373054D|nr:hypothetical protein [Rudanella lutea]
MILSHVISDAALAITGVGVFWHFFGHLPFYNRLLWGFFLLTISLAAIAGTARFAGVENLEALHESLQTLASTLGIVCVVMATWALVMRRTVKLIPFVMTLVLGLFLFVVLLLPDVRVFRPVSSSLGILLVMLLGVFGLMRRVPNALWIVIAVMLAAIATKAESFSQLMHPTDFYHYMLALSLLGFGKAVQK